MTPLSKTFPWKFTVVTVCTLLTRDLVAIVKFFLLCPQSLTPPKKNKNWRGPISYLTQTSLQGDALQTDTVTPRCSSRVTKFRKSVNFFALNKVSQLQGVSIPLIFAFLHIFPIPKWLKSTFLYAAYSHALHCNLQNVSGYSTSYSGRSKRLSFSGVPATSATGAGAPSSPNACVWCVWCEPKTAKSVSIYTQWYVFWGVNDVPLNFGSQTHKLKFWAHK